LLLPGGGCGSTPCSHSPLAASVSCSSPASSPQQLRPHGCVELAGLSFVLISVLPDFLFHLGRDPGHRPRLLLLGHGGAPGEHAPVKTGDL
jgi:hypothetical protein